MARQGSTKARQAALGEVWRDRVSSGQAGLVRLGKAWRVKARQARQDTAGNDEAGQGNAGITHSKRNAIVKRKRIEEAIEILNKVPKRKFDLCSWAELTEKEWMHVGKKGLKTVAINGCGTSGCACGWIASDPRAIKRGLMLSAMPMFDDDGKSRYGGIDVVFDHDGHLSYGFEAAADYFDISFCTAEVLFDPYYYSKSDDPKLVAHRLQLLLVKGELHNGNHSKWGLVNPQATSARSMYETVSVTPPPVVEKRKTK
jgi:curved DNA-binding protein CbpA